MHPSGHPVQKGLEVGSPGRRQLDMGWGPEGKTDRTRGPDWLPGGQTRFPLSSQGLFWGFSEKPDLPCTQNSKAGSRGRLTAWPFGDELPGQRAHMTARARSALGPRQPPSRPPRASSLPPRHGAQDPLAWPQGSEACGYRWEPCGLRGLLPSRPPAPPRDSHRWVPPPNTLTPVRGPPESHRHTAAPAHACPVI